MPRKKPIPKPVAPPEGALLVRAAELASLVRLGPRKLLELERTDRSFPPALKLGGRTSPRLYSRAAVERWIAERTAART